MSGRSSGPRRRPERPASNPWVIRAVVVVAVAILVVGLVIAALNGYLFTRPSTP